MTTMTMIKAVSPPVTINHVPAVVVAVGGGVIGDRIDAVDVSLRCPTCGAVYPMALNPRALALSPIGAQVLPGYVEMCPETGSDGRYHEHPAGTILEVII